MNTNTLCISKLETQALLNLENEIKVNERDAFFYNHKTLEFARSLKNKKCLDKNKLQLWSS